MDRSVKQKTCTNQIKRNVSYQIQQILVVIYSNVVSHQNVPEPTYELVSKVITADDNVNMEKNPSYSVTGVQDSSVDHHYDVIPSSDIKAKKQ